MENILTTFSRIRSSFLRSSRMMKRLQQIMEISHTAKVPETLEIHILLTLENPKVSIVFKSFLLWALLRIEVKLSKALE